MSGTLIDNGKCAVASVDRHMVIAEMIVATASEALPVRTDTISCSAPQPLSPAVLCERVADHSASGLVWVAAAAFVDPSTASISDMVGSKTFVYPDQHARLLRPWRIGLAVPCD